MSYKAIFSKEHWKNLPTVRIKRVVLDNFKSVEHGEVIMNCARNFSPAGTEPDIMGIYGQNGSGKTSIIEALAIMKTIMSGDAVEWNYADCVSVGKEYARVSVTFDLQYPNDIMREVVYSFEMRRGEYTDEEKDIKRNEIAELTTLIDLPYDVKRVLICNEKIELSWENSRKKQVIIDTNSEDKVFLPDSKRKELIGNKKENLVEHRINKRNANNGSKSYIFDENTLNLFEKISGHTVYLDVLLELKHYANRFLIVVDQTTTQLVLGNFFLPLITRNGLVILNERQTEIRSKESYEILHKSISYISMVLNSIVPDLEIELKKLSDTVMKDGTIGVESSLVAKRKDIEIPLYGESDGVRKIISMLSMLTATYNQKSTTMIIDEFDSGVFEYLLGEILQIFEESGKGQLIFTSHNLRPLEVINKKYLCFTTTNPKNRYIRLKNIASTNNLRDTYFREIVMNEQDEPIYNKTKRHKILAALRKAGGDL